MKTLTEFAAITLKNAHAKKQELTTAGKTAEELPAALGEALKVEGDKLTYLLAALELVGEKTNDLKRVIVSSLNEGETAPSSAKLVGEKYFTVEHYVSMHKPAPEQGRGGRDDKRGGRGKKGGRGGRDDKRGGGRGEGRGGERGGDRPGGGGGRGPRPAQAGGQGGKDSLPKPNPVPAKTETPAS